MGKVKRDGKLKFERLKTVKAEVKDMAVMIEKLSPKEGEIILIKDKDKQVTEDSYKNMKAVLEVAGINNYVMVLKGGLDITVLRIRSKKDVIVIEDSDTDPLKAEFVQKIFDQAGIKNKVMILDSGMKAKLQ